MLFVLKLNLVDVYKETSLFIFPTRFHAMRRVEVSLANLGYIQGLELFPGLITIGKCSISFCSPKGACYLAVQFMSR